MSHGFDAATAAPEARGAEEPRLPGLLGAFDNINVNEVYYLRPRMTPEILCTNC